MIPNGQLLTIAANAITFDMQLHAAKYNGECHLPPRWYVVKYWAALACYSGMVQPRCMALGQQQTVPGVCNITGTCHVIQ